MVDEKLSDRMRSALVGARLKEGGAMLRPGLPVTTVVALINRGLVEPSHVDRHRLTAKGVRVRRQLIQEFMQLIEGGGDQ